ncbi:hypothetical protein CK203_101029 [Vitis vinifera]|uniref:Uncharacterized protein n=1 Tax=Vitis vinifera TaxID=29760 RepID=A0A438CFE8_VITVI|nr:hypothetical protein CK203_101029 [Vitis vinifera]
MTKGTDRMMRNPEAVRRPTLVLSPFTLAYDIAGSAPRGFGIPSSFPNSLSPPSSGCVNFENLAAVWVVTCHLGKWVTTAPAVCVFA